MGADIVNDTVSSAESTTTGLISSVVCKAQVLFEAAFPPEKRAQWWEKLKEFASRHPKIAAFLLTNIMLSGGPLFLFVVFTMTVFIVSLLAALIIALIAALLFTVFMLLVALFVVLPTIFMTTMAATFIFVWGLGGYYLIKWFNEGKTPAEAGGAVGDVLNSVTGGRLTWMVDSLRGPAVGPGKGVNETVEQLKGDGNGNGLCDTSLSGATPPKKNAPAKLHVKTPTKTPL